MTRPTPSKPRFDQLHESEPQSLPVRLAAFVGCSLLVGIINFIASFFGRLRSRRRKQMGAAGARIVLTGSFASDNWIEAHARPLAESPYCEHLWIVTDASFVPLEKVTYVCPPTWLRKLLGRVPARAVVFCLIAIRYRANVLGGLHLLLNGLIALAAARVLGARAVYYCVGGWAELLDGGVHTESRLFNLVSQPRPSLERALLRAVRQMDLIVTMGTGAQAFFRQAGVTAPIEAMPGGIDPARFCGAAREPQYDLITVARVVPIKRMDILLQVVRGVAKSLPQVKAVIVGDGPDLPTLKEQAAQLGVLPNVVFAGKQNNVEQWLQSARLFVLTSDSEGLSLALMEAMMAGLPCVVSDVGDLKDLVHEGENGWRPAPRDVDAFVERIVGLLKDPEAYRRFSTAAHAAAFANRPDAMAARWDRILSTWGARPFTPQLPAKWQRSPWVWSRRDLWERTNTVARWQAAQVFARVSPQTWLGHKFRHTLEWVRQSETWSRDQITAYQLQEVQRMVTLAHQCSPYYRKVFRGLGFEPGDLRTLEDLSKLPFIDAETVRQHLHTLCTARPEPGTADLISTSGTGGRPLRFFIVRDRSAFEYAHLVASWMRTGYQLGMPMAILRGRVVPETNGTHYLYDAFLRHHYFSTFQMNDANMARYLSRIQQLGPCYLHVYPSSIAMFARFMQRTRQGPLSNVRGIIAESEIVYPDQRRFVAETLGCRYFSCYGHTEKLVLAAECEHTTNYHVWPGYGYCELLDAHGKPITTPGVRGEIVGTGFINSIVPFIRYRTGDFATYVGNRCGQCGRNHLMLQDIRGHRIHEMLVAADGSNIPWTALNMHDATFDHVLQMQFYQEAPGRAILRVVPDDQFNPKAEQGILQTLGQKLGDRLAITIQRVNALPPTTSGKAVYIDQRIPMNAPKGSQFHAHLEPNH